MKIKCKCGKLNEVKEAYPDYHNWKCSHCGAINIFYEPINVIWKCDTATVKRGE